MHISLKFYPTNPDFSFYEESRDTDKKGNASTTLFPLMKYCVTRDLLEPVSTIEHLTDILKTSEVKNCKEKKATYNKVSDRVEKCW